MRDIALAIGEGLALPIVAKSPEAAADHFGWLANFVAADIPASSVRTQQHLGWQPKQPGLILDLKNGNYFNAQ